MLKENLKEVENNICAACLRSNRDRSEITLIAVSKTKPVDMIYEAMKEDIREFGENKVQEICDKTNRIKESLHWHMIGHLQRNKVKYIVDKVCMIHSVDSVRLAEQINLEAIKKNIISLILIEVNIAKEDSKYGLLKEEVIPVILEVSKFHNVRIKGLMTIAPFVENAEDNRKYFKELQKLSIDIKSKNIDNVYMEELSMGMTNDYEVAIEEGSTLVRVGTGIFGGRTYSI